MIAALSTEWSAGPLCCSALAEAVVPYGPAKAEELRNEKERFMTSIKTIAEKLSAWRRYREAVRELSRLNDRELSDIGIRRGDIEFIVRQSIAA